MTAQSGRDSAEYGVDGLAALDALDPSHVLSPYGSADAVVC